MSGFQDKKWVYIGKRMGNKFPLVDGYHDVAENKSYFIKADKARGLIGGIYNVKHDPEINKIIIVKWSGERHNDDNQILTWRAESDLCENHIKLKKAEKEGRHEVELAALAPLRKIYWDSSSEGQAILEMQVLKYLRGWKK